MFFWFELLHFIWEHLAEIVAFLFFVGFVGFVFGAVLVAVLKKKRTPFSWSLQNRWRCPHCGNVNDTKERTCVGCNARRPAL